MKQETLPIVDCSPEILNALTRKHYDELEEKGCKFETYFQALKKMQDGTASSRREASRQIAEETDQQPSKVESEVRRAESSLKQAMEAEKARKAAEKSACVIGDADEKPLKPLVHSPPVDKIAEGRAKLLEKYGSDHRKAGPKLEDIGEEVPPDYEAYKKICDALDFPLPTTRDWVDWASEIYRLRSPEDTITELMCLISSLPKKPKVEVREFFKHHQKERYDCGLCWWCLDRKPRSKGEGLCGSCKKAQAGWMIGAKFRAKIKRRGIKEDSVEAWTAILNKSKALNEEVKALLEKEKYPRIDAGLAKEVRNSLHGAWNLTSGRSSIEAVSSQDNVNGWSRLTPRRQ
jgi:hypothetical protein